MKRFIYKTTFFVIPFIPMFFISLVFYSGAESPDLLRLGYIPNIHKGYRDNFQLNEKEKFDKLSNHKKKKYKILTIGDSFSEQSGFGYKNMLANDFSVLHVDRFISNNQIQTLIDFTNGDFFETYNIEYIILQNVERHIIKNIKNIRLNDRIMLNEIDSIIFNHKTEKVENSYNLFSKTTIRFPLYDLPKFFFKKNYLSNELVNNVELNSNSLFSNKSNKLLFFNEDLKSTEQNNLKENVNRLNIILNRIALKLRKRNIKLIVLPSPDKYDLYYDYISEKKDFKRPIFFDLMKVVKKDYVYIDAKENLASKIKHTKDLYFYDDTHWSPIASKIITDKIKSEMEKSDKSTNAQQAFDKKADSVVK
jgi:hypothetical protein